MNDRKKIIIDPARLEELAAEGFSRNQIADTLGVNPGTLATKLAKEPELREAYDRGRGRRGVKPEAAAPSDDEKILQAIRHGYRTVAAIKEFTGLKNGLFMNAIERLEVGLQIKSRDERMLTHYYLHDEDFPTLERPADAPPAPVSAALVSSSRHAETLERIQPELKNVTPAANGNVARSEKQPELEIIGRAVVPLAERIDVTDALRGLEVERAYFDYHGTPSPTMSTVLSTFESTLHEIAREIVAH